MKFRNPGRKLNIFSAAVLAVLMAVLCLAGCAPGQNTAGGRNDNGVQSTAGGRNDGSGQSTAGGRNDGSGRNTAGTPLRAEEMGKLCYYRNERDAQFDADMEIVEGRIDALTDGNYLKEETEIVLPEGSRYAVNFYVPKETYGNYSLGDISRILISRPMNLWLTNDTSSGPTNSFEEKIALPRDAIESVELLYGCPELFNPLDFGMKEKEFDYLAIRLTEKYCRENPQIREWTQMFILQDIEGLEGYAHIRVVPDAENRNLIIPESEGLKGRCRSLLYSYTHEPLSAPFYVFSLPVIEWESGEAMKGTGQIENTGFKTATVVNEYAPEEAYVSDRNWEQAMQAIRERLDAAGIPYALGHRPGDDRSIVIRMEQGLFSDAFMDSVIKNPQISFSALGEILEESPSDVKVSAVDRSAKKVLSLDMSALRKETFSKLSMNCVKAGGGRIVLRVNDTAAAYGYCDKTINDGRFVMDHNGYTAEEGFTDSLSFMPAFLEALISGTQIPKLNAYKVAVTLKNIEQVYLAEDGQFCLPETNSIPRQNLIAVIKNKLGEMEYTRVGILTSGTPCVQFALPEGETANEQVAATMSRVFKALSEEIFTYWMRFDFVDGNGNPVLMFLTKKSYLGNMTRFEYSLYNKGGLAEEDVREIRKLMTEDASLADLADMEPDDAE